METNIYKMIQRTEYDNNLALIECLKRVRQEVFLLEQTAIGGNIRLTSHQEVIDIIKSEIEKLMKENNRYMDQL